MPHSRTFRVTLLYIQNDLLVSIYISLGPDFISPFYLHFFSHICLACLANAHIKFHFHLCYLNDIWCLCFPKLKSAKLEEEQPCKFKFWVNYTLSSLLSKSQKLLCLVEIVKNHFLCFLEKKKSRVIVSAT